MTLIAQPDTLAPLGACLAPRHANMLTTLQRGAERLRQGGRGAAALYCKRPSSLPPRALQLIHSRSHKERHTRTELVAGEEGSTLLIPYSGKRKDKVTDFCQSHPAGRRMVAVAVWSSQRGGSHASICVCLQCAFWSPPHNCRKGSISLRSCFPVANTHQSSSPSSSPGTRVTGL